MDELLPKVMLETIQICSVMIGVIVIVVTANYWMLIPLIVLLTIFYLMRIVYLRTVQSVKRLETVGKCLL